MSDDRTGGSGRDRLTVSLDVSAVPPSPAGAGRYTLELARALSDRTDTDLVLISRRADAARWRGLGPSGRPTLVAPRAPAARPVRLAWEQAVLPFVLSSLRPDVHHSPHYTMPELARVPVVVTVHDTTYFDHPEWHERSKVLVFRRAIRVAARRAAVVICVSATTAEHLRAVGPVVAPVVVAPHGVDLERFTPVEPEPGADAAALARLGVDAGRPFVAFVGTLEPRKGVADLVAAFDRVAGRHPECLLVLAGQPGWGTDRLEAALAAATHRDRVVATGYVPDEAVPALLRRASVVAYPSLAEGYGLPALEALACGARLITTAGTAMAELSEGAAVLVAPGDVDQLAAALEAALEGADPVGDDDRRRRGLEIAAQRTWAASAACHVEAYRLAASGRHPPHRAT
ncbi:MAG TPA: glycosyltransferase family 1 protein [Acidimicrobiales bacterium]|nr:glycosyltransferase family 1 protein [Acidimicrobiales bacterium]